MSEKTSLPDYEKATTTSILYVWDPTDGAGKWVAQSKKVDTTEVLRTKPEDY